MNGINHGKGDLSAHANEIAATCIEPRYLFDACIEFLSVIFYCLRTVNAHMLSIIEI